MILWSNHKIEAAVRTFFPQTKVAFYYKLKRYHEPKKTLVFLGKLQ
jgi:hypothetical protein